MGCQKCEQARTRLKEKVLKEKERMMRTKTQEVFSNIHIYVLNLDRRPDRYSEMKTQLDKLGLLHERMSAVDGNNLEEPLPIAGVKEKYWNKYALGIIESNRKIISDAIENDYEEILILEDDVIFVDDFVNKFKLYKSLLPNDYNMTMLACSNFKDIKSCTQVVPPHIFKLKRCLGAFALLINRRCFQIIKNILDNKLGPLDILYYEIQDKHPCYLFYPSLVDVKSDLSNVSGDYLDTTDGRYLRNPVLEKIYQNSIKEQICCKGD